MLERELARVDMQHHVGWLAGILDANLELAAGVVEERLQDAEAVAERLRAAAVSVRAR